MEKDVKINSEKLKALRVQKGWTQQQLADICGLSMRTIQRTEKSGNASQETISSLSSVFEVNRESWQLVNKVDTTFRVNHKGWQVAFIAIIVFQAFAGLVVYLFIDSVSVVWLKALFAIDGTVLLAYAVLALTEKRNTKPQTKVFN
jgi:transcriptional regulator with XRE-family HTH domain